MTTPTVNAQLGVGALATAGLGVTGGLGAAYGAGALALANTASLQASVSLPLAVPAGTFAIGAANTFFTGSNPFGAVPPLAAAAENAGAVGSDLIAARQATAQSFYQQGGWSADAIPSHLDGIDFTQPVEVVTLPQGSLVTQYQLAGRQVGNYFTPLGTPSDIVGFDTAGRVPGLFELQSDTQVLQSTAKDILDWNGSGTIFKGGGTQYFAPNNSAFVRVPEQ